MLCVLCNTGLFRLLRRSNGTAGVFGTNTDTKKESKLSQSAEVSTCSMEVTNRIALSMASIPWRLWFAPLDAAESPEKSVTIPAASI